MMILKNLRRDIVKVVYNAAFISSVFAKFGAISKLDSGKIPTQIQAMDLFLWRVWSGTKYFLILLHKSCRKRAISNTNRF